MSCENPEHERLNRAIVSSFRRHYSDFPEGNIRAGCPRREPDIVVETQNGLIGIEITRFYREHGARSSALQAQESLKERIVERARGMYASGGHPPLRVSIFGQALR
jgi:hypothetical protein